MNILTRAAVPEDLDAVEQIYNDINDYYALPGRYEKGPRWIKGVYPLRSDAEEALSLHTLHVAVIDNRIAGTVICDSAQGECYRTVSWQLPFDVPVLIVHKLAVHPDFLKCGVASALLAHAEDLAKSLRKQAVRLDTYEENHVASALYEKNGYLCRGLVDLGLGELYGLKWYKAYEKLI